MQVANLVLFLIGIVYSIQLCEFICVLETLVIIVEIIMLRRQGEQWRFAVVLEKGINIL